ncbi:NIPSNAP family protein [Mesorhizobium sp. RP14(2022)]|uniref:NIPSNAP family protein n=1 Tax=Mesorhizobium liriopis TaxID=2953882 RepID=A0ABT1C3C9_9HYPH|nr:NIPSNAP family protein [Mesorhizobium liriopis]MCO6049331.1 NIPSNAP family protein [Mesorhizobium liriopis]
MFIDMRTYTLKNGNVPKFLKLYEEEGMEVQKRILGNMVGYYYTDIGNLNQVVHMWGYDSMDDRWERRKNLQASKEWQDYAVQMRPLVDNIENKILVPAPFFTPSRP